MPSEAPKGVQFGDQPEEASMEVSMQEEQPLLPDSEPKLEKKTTEMTPND